MQLEAPPPEPPDRPRFVSAVGWTGVILGAVVALKSLVEITVWKIVEPAMPALLGAAPQPGAEVPFARMIYAHLTSIKLTEAAFWTFAAIASGALLLLRPWARRAVQGVCTFLVVYVVGVGCVWTHSWLSVAARGPSFAYTASQRIGILVAALGVCAAVAGGLIAVVAGLGRDRVRAAFEPKP